MDKNKGPVRRCAFQQGYSIENVRQVVSSLTFPRHMHQEWVIGNVRSGAKQFDFVQHSVTATEGATFVIPAGVVHTASAVTMAQVSYTAWFVPPSLISSADLSPRVFVDREVRSCFNRFESAMDQGGSPGQRNDSWETLLLAVNAKAQAMGQHEARLKTAAQYLRDNLSRSITLEELARLEGVSRYHMLRMFKREWGLPPHAYQDWLRVEQAKELLRAGQSIADVAFAVGFSDQSHLTRRLKRLNGYTPGELRRGAQYHSRSGAVAKPTLGFKCPAH